MMYPKPATKLTEELVAQNVRGHAPIHDRSVHSNTNNGSASEEEAMTSGPIIVSRKVERKGGKV